LEYITIDKLCYYASPIYRHFNDLIKYIHANVNHPENHNIYLSSLDSKYIKAYDGKDWKAFIKDELLQNVLYRYCDLFSDNIDKITDKVGENQIKSLKKWICVNEKDDFKHLKIPLSLTLYNNKDVIKKTMTIKKQQENDTNKDDIDQFIV